MVSMPDQKEKIANNQQNRHRAWTTNIPCPISRESHKLKCKSIRGTMIVDS